MTRHGHRGLDVVSAAVEEDLTVLFDQEGELRSAGRFGGDEFGHCGHGAEDVLEEEGLLLVSVFCYIFFLSE